MPKELTRRQLEILEFIKRETQRKGYPPSVREIGEAVGLNSSSTVHGHLERLEEKGYIRRDATKPRAIEIIDGFYPMKKTVTIPLVGQVTAGQPILAEENIEEVYQFPKALVQNEDVFMLAVCGDSMIEAGIFDRDYVIVRQQNYAKNGDIVVALIEDSATIKTFYKEKDYIRLQPENSCMEPIIAKDVIILGKVIGVYRRLH
jgi:repressor LexA